MAPAELAFFAAASDAYFRDPDHALATRKRSDELLGSGFDVVVTLVTPVALAVAGAVYQQLTEKAGEVVVKRGRRLLSRLLRRRRDVASGTQAIPLPLSESQRAEVRATAERGPGSSGSTTSRCGRWSRPSMRPSAMMAESPAPVRVPAGTTVRFALLVTLALAAAASIYALIMPPGFARTAQAFDQCQVNAGIYPRALGPINIWVGSEQQARLGSYGQCLAERIPERMWWMLAGLAALLVVAALLYYVQPYWRIRRSRLVGLDPVDAGEVLAYLRDLAVQAGLRRTPTFLADPVNRRASGLAFGRGREPYVSLDAGLLTLFRTDPKAFRATVLHELAHLRNRDVAVTYLTMAVWRAFLLVALLPWVLLLALLSGGFAGETGFLLESAGRISITVVIVYLTRNAVLRSRERYADARVSTWLQSTSPEECLPGLPASRGWRWVSWFRTHPDPAGRAAALADREALPRPGFWESFATGVAFQLGWIQILMPLLTWGGAPQVFVAILQRVWGLVLAALVIVTALRARSVLIVPGVGLAAGAVVGEHLQIVGGAVCCPAGRH
jgi:Zn-dependent protease with chaperone function